MTRRAARLHASLGVGSMVAVAIATLGAAPAPARTMAAGTAPAQAETGGDVRLRLVDQTFAVAPDGDLRFDYLLTGLVDDPLELVAPPPRETTTTQPGGDATVGDPSVPTTTVPPPPPPVRITAEITNYAPISDPDVARLVGSDVDPDAFAALSDVVDGVAVDVRPFASVTTDGSVSMTIDLGTDVLDSVGEKLKFDVPGLYPVRIELLVGDPADDVVIATAGTVVERLAGPGDAVTRSPAIDLAVVSVIQPPGPTATGPDLAEADSDLDDALALADALEAPASLAVPPPLVSARAATVDGAARLAESLAGDELIAQPIVPLDVSAAVGAGRAEAYTRLVRAGERALIDAVPTTPTRNDLWIATSPLSAAGAQHLRDLGVRFVVMPEQIYRETVSADLPASDQFVDIALPDGGALPLLLVDPLADELTPAAADDILESSTPTEWAVEQLAAMLAEQAAEDAEGVGPAPRRSRILTTPDLLPPDARLLDGLVRLATTTPSVTFDAASTLIGSTDVQRADGQPVTITLPAVAGPSLVDRIVLIDTTALTMASAASMLPDDDPRPAAWTSELDALISTGYTEAEVEAATDSLVAEADELKGAIQLPEPFTFTLTGRTGTIDVRIGNTSDEPLKVQVQLSSTKLSFPEGNQEVTLRPLDETSVVVPVAARSNGTSSIDLRVATPAGEPIGGPVSLTATVTALTGLGQVLTAGFILVLGTWWFAHWRARRREPYLAPNDDAPGGAHHTTNDVSSASEDGGKVESDSL